MFLRFMGNGPSGFNAATDTETVLTTGSPPDLSDKHAIVTGSTNGVGKATAFALARGGAHVTVVGRNQGKIDAVLEEAKSLDGVDGRMDGMLCDLGDLASVKRFAEAYNDRGHALDILVNNAGVMALPTRTPTTDGFEAQMGTNHCGHFALTCGLMPALLKSTSARVVCLSSMGHRLAKPDFVRGDQLEGEAYDPWVAYGNSKLANVMFAQELHDRYSNKGVQACSVHPGGIFTGLQGHVPMGTMLFWFVVSPFFFKSTDQGAATSVYCAAKADNLTGGYYEDCNASTISPLVEAINTKENRELLWKTSQSMTGVEFPSV